MGPQESLCDNMRTTQIDTVDTRHADHLARRGGAGKEGGGGVKGVKTRTTKKETVGLTFSAGGRDHERTLHGLQTSKQAGGSVCPLLQGPPTIQ